MSTPLLNTTLIGFLPLPDSGWFRSGIRRIGEIPSGIRRPPPMRPLMKYNATAGCGWWILFSVLVAIVPVASVGAAVDYAKDVKPLLRERCYSCHGALKQKAKLRLDTVELMLKGGEDGAVIERGKPDKSSIIGRVTNSDPEERMPPPHEGEPFTAAQVAMLREWIATGAPAPADEKPETDPKEHWAFRPRVRPAVPVVANMKWVRNPVDAFIAKQHGERGLTPQPEASRAVLLRRLYLDLIGLPPTVAEIAAFENDASPEWYECAVNRLLDDPRHGERWARHWMDVWRYSDWWGLGEQLRNSQKHIWHWRDWIVESLNADTPYDEMIRLMLAADELHPNDLHALRATGFLARNWFLFNRDHWLDETVEHVSKGFLGITLNCVKCHDHKFDPFAQADYYKMRAFFEPYHVRMDVVPGEADLVRDGLPRAFDGVLDTPTYRFVRGEESRPDKSVVIAPGVPDLLAFKKLEIAPVSLPAEAWQPERRYWVADAAFVAARKKEDSAGDALHAAKVKTEQAKPEDVAAAQGALHVAELALILACMEKKSVELRIVALSATWARTARPVIFPADDDEREKVETAIRWERKVAVARAEHAVADAELRHSQAGAATTAKKTAAAEKELKAARESLEKAEKALAAPIAATDKVTPFVGAEWTPTRFLTSTKDDPKVEFGPKSSGRRSALADWITDVRNPLTARVAVNHLWSRHMGAPLVATTFDFGRKNAPPAHVELIDWLACELVENGWSMKHVHRLIVTSAAYRMMSSATGGEANAANDPDNVRLWRRTPIRLEAEAVRDSLLALAGELDPTMGGPSIPASAQAESKRRSLNFFHSNNERNLFLTTFDEANVKECYRRDESIVPQQALALLNSRLVQDSAARIAARLGADVPADDDAAFVRKAFRGVLGVVPNDGELAACVKTMDAWRKLPKSTPEQARAHLIWALLNHNDFVTLR